MESWCQSQAARRERGGSTSSLTPGSLWLHLILKSTLASYDRWNVRRMLFKLFIRAETSALSAKYIFILSHCYSRFIKFIFLHCYCVTRRLHDTVSLTRLSVSYPFLGRTTYSGQSKGFVLAVHCSLDYSLVCRWIVTAVLLLPLLHENNWPFSREVWTVLVAPMENKKDVLST